MTSFRSTRLHFQLFICRSIATSVYYSRFFSFFQ
jgi:hypothetical protein